MLLLHCTSKRIARISGLSSVSSFFLYCAIRRRIGLRRAMKQSRLSAEVRNSNKDLLHLDRDASVLEKRLLSCTSGPKSARKDPPVITSMPESCLLGRIKSFLPALDQANRKLFSEIQEGGTEQFNIESVSATEERYVEMDLALGVAELNTPDAVAAAELAANGQVLKLDDSAASSDESTDSDTDEEDNVSMSSIGELLDGRRTVKESRQMFSSDQENCQNNKSQYKRKKIELL